MCLFVIRDIYLLVYHYVCVCVCVFAKLSCKESETILTKICTVKRRMMEINLESYTTNGGTRTLLGIKWINYKFTKKKALLKDIATGIVVINKWNPGQGTLQD